MNNSQTLWGDPDDANKPKRLPSNQDARRRKSKEPRIWN